jgi:DNA-binding transcriptional LysR family regulator
MNNIQDNTWSHLDLNLLRVFVVIWQERHLGTAAERLNLTPSAVSHALRRLRVHWQDELFLRSGRRLKPTAKAQQLAPPLQEYLELLRSTIESESRFAPLESQRTFVLGMRDAFEVTLLPSLMAILQREAPGTSVRSIRLDRNSLEEDLRLGRLDAAIDVRFELPELIQHTPIASDPPCVVMRLGHPLAKGITVEQYLEAQHVVVSGRASGNAIEDNTLARLRLPKRNIVLRCQNYQAAAQYVANSNALLTKSIRVSEEAATTLLLHQTKLPFHAPNFDVHLYWHIRTENDSALSWLRDRIKKCFLATQLPKKQKL